MRKGREKSVGLAFVFILASWKRYGNSGLHLLQHHVCRKRFGFGNSLYADAGIHIHVEAIEDGDGVAYYCTVTRAASRTSRLSIVAAIQQQRNLIRVGG
jgi:hypothetical protein